MYPFMVKSLPKQFFHRIKSASLHLGGLRTAWYEFIPNFLPMVVKLETCSKQKKKGHKEETYLISGLNNNIYFTKQ